MRIIKWPVWMKCLVFVCVLLPLFAGTAFAEGSSLFGGTDDSSLESPLVVPEALPLLGGEALSDAEEARRASPEAVVARMESETKYEGLSVEESVKLAEQVFPGVVQDPGGGLSQLSEGESVIGYLNDHSAQVDLPGGGHGVIESVDPIAVEASPGRWVAVDLGLVESGGVFEPKTPVVGVRIPKQLQDGVSLVGSGVSLTPVVASGVAVGGSEGRVDGSVVFYGGVGVGSDVDMALKPSSLGVSAETFLRSERSPESLYFRVGLPQGASLVQAPEGLGVQVVSGGRVVAYVLPPSAYDAAGRPVPVSISFSGDVLKSSVDARGGEFEYPIVVDPTVVDKETNTYTNWQFFTDNNTRGFCNIYGDLLGVLSCSESKGFETWPVWGLAIYNKR
jgi:hypothetical protein